MGTSGRWLWAGASGAAALLLLVALAGCGGRPRRGGSGDRDAMAGADAAGDGAGSLPEAAVEGGAVEGGAGGGVGAPCETAADCAQPPRAECFRGSVGPVSFPGGFCSRACSDEDSDCGPEGICASVSSSGGSSGVSGQFCTTRCERDEDCRQAEGYRCQLILGFGACVPPGL